MIFSKFVWENRKWETTQNQTRSKSVNQRNRNSQIHPQQCQSTGNQNDSHGEPGIRKKKQTKFENRKSSNKCHQIKNWQNWRNNRHEKHEQEHTSQLWEEGTISSSFLAVKISIPTKWHLAWPCLPVLEVETSTTCHRETESIHMHQSESIKIKLD